MNPGATFVEEILTKSREALSQLEQLEAVCSFVDRHLPIPRPYLGSGAIELILIGQDPTVDDENGPSAVKTVLKIGSRGPLHNFLMALCRDLGLSLAKNVYATNACKNFFTQRPTTIKEVDVLEASAPVWLPILQIELAQFPDATVISLGRPVLSMLVKPGFPHELKHYWGYHQYWRQGKSTPMRPIAADESTIGRTIFPFGHQTMIRGNQSQFYQCKRSDYIAFIREHSELRY